MAFETLEAPPLGSEQLLPVNMAGTTRPEAPNVLPRHQAEISAGSHQPDIEPGIFKIPVELILKMLKLTDLRSAFSLARSNRAFKQIWDSNRQHVILSILQTEMSPFDDLLQAVAFRPGDINIPLGPCLRRRIYHMSRLCSEGEIFQTDEEAYALLPPVTLAEEHFDLLLHLFKVVRGWEQLFPRYRFESASDCRELHPHESERLRAALYRWMSYAHFFHGELPRPNQFVPQKYSTDPRCKRLRLLSDVELHELNDLWQTVQKMVQVDICPSTEMVQRKMDWTFSKEEAERIGFGTSKPGPSRATFSWNDSTFIDFDSNVHSAIVETFLKLSPAEILHFVINRSAYSRDRLIREVRLANPDILSDQQSLGHALSAVMEERQGQRLDLEDPDCPVRSLDEARSESSGGVLDLESMDAEFREFWGGNGQRALGRDAYQRTRLGLRVLTNKGRLEPQWPVSFG